MPGSRVAPLSISLLRGNVCNFSSANIVIHKKPKTAYSDMAFALDTHISLF